MLGKYNNIWRPCRQCKLYTLKKSFIENSTGKYWDLGGTIGFFKVPNNLHTSLGFQSKKGSILRNAFPWLFWFNTVSVEAVMLAKQDAICGNVNWGIETWVINILLWNCVEKYKIGLVVISLYIIFPDTQTQMVISGLNGRSMPMIFHSLSICIIHAYKYGSTYFLFWFYHTSWPWHRQIWQYIL